MKPKLIMVTGIGPIFKYWCRKSGRFGYFIVTEMMWCVCFTNLENCIEAVNSKRYWV